MQRGSFLVSEAVRYSPHSIVPWEDRIVENWWNLEKQFSHIFQKLERDLETQHQNWQTDGNLACGLGKSDLTDEHFVRTDDGVVYARNVRRLAENSWSEENLKAVVETPQKPRSMTTDDALDPRVVPEIHEQLSPNEEANENIEESGETPDKPEDMDHEMEEETLPEPDTAATSSSSRGEKRTETQENVFARRRLMAKSPKRPITFVPPPEDPVKRRQLKKQTDTRNDELLNVDENLLNVVSKLTKDENMPEVNSDEDKEMPKFTVLRRNDEGKTEGAEFTERNGYNDSCEKD